VLGRVLRIVDVLAGGPGPLDRARHELSAASRQEELRRGGDDRPAVAGERSRHEWPQVRERGRELRGLALEGGRQVLDEVHLVDVAARDRLPNRLDRLAVLGIAPAALPGAEERATDGHERRLVRGPDPAREERQRGTGLRRRRGRRTT